MPAKLLAEEVTYTHFVQKKLEEKINKLPTFESQSIDSHRFAFINSFGEFIAKKDFFFINLNFVLILNKKIMLNFLMNQT